MESNLVIKGITKTFKLSKKQMRIEKTKDALKIACNNLSFEAYKGEIFGLLGPNGAGKTTALRCIATLIKPDSGDIFVGGYSVMEEETAVRKQIGFLTSELKLEDHFTPNYLFNYFSKLHGLEEDYIIERRDLLFDKFGVDKFAEVKVGKLSTGMKQKISIAISLVHDPDIIIFDEPTNGLDILTARTVTDYLTELKEQGKTVVISTHILSVVEKLCDRVGIIIDGKLKLCDTLENVLKSTDNNSLEDVFFNLIKESSMEGEEL